MKKQLTILLLFFFTCTFAWSQFKSVKTTTPCNKELLLKTPGRWMPIGRFLSAKNSIQQEQEFVHRLDVIQKMAFNIYPEPMAFDAVQGYGLAKKDFASQLKIETTAYGTSDSYINGTSTIFFEYFVKFCDYFCGNNKNEYFKGAGCETGTNIAVTINNLDPLFFPLYLDKFYKEIMRIDGRPINMLGVIREKKWKNYDVYSKESGSGESMVMIHRDGMLPYIPVTRKQYLERSIQCLNRQYDEIIKGYEQPEGLQLLMSKKERDEEVIKSKKIRDDLLKYYKDELEATTRAGLLDSPAVITGFLNPLTTQPIFTTQAKGGNMLVTENPAYFKKDLPKYIPQLIIYSMWNGEDGPDPALNPYHLYYQNFPIEKLQAMIDK